MGFIVFEYSTMMMQSITIGGGCPRPCDVIGCLLTDVSVVIDDQMNLDMNLLSGLSPLIVELCLLRYSNGVSVDLGMK